MDVGLWHFSDIRRCPLLGREAVNSGRGAERKALTDSSIPQWQIETEPKHAS
jgi:hypothetical protein